MKKTNRIFGMMILAGLLAVGSVSCKKNTEGLSFTFNLPPVEGFVADDDKAYVDVTDGSKLKWYEGDQMMVYSVDKDNTTPIMSTFTLDRGAGTPNGHFDNGGVTIPKGSYGYFAFYPASKAVSVSEGNFATFKVDPTQTYDPALNFAGTSFANKLFMDPQGVVAASTTDQLSGTVTSTLQHIFGFVNVKVKKTTTGAAKYVKKVAIEDYVLNLTGNMTINIPEITSERLAAIQTLGADYATSPVQGDSDLDDYLAALSNYLQAMGYSSEPEGKIVTLDCSAYSTDGIQITSDNKYFIIPLRPGALAGAFKIILYYSDGSNKVFSFVSGSKQYTVRPGRFVNIQCTI